MIKKAKNNDNVIDVKPENEQIKNSINEKIRISSPKDYIDVKKSLNTSVIEISSSSEDEVRYIKTTPSHPRDKRRQKLNKDDEKKKEKGEVIVVGDNDDEDNDVDFVRVTSSHPREVLCVKANPAHPRYRMDVILRNWPASIIVDADVLKDLLFFNAKIKVGGVNKIKRREAIMDKINKQ